MNESFKENYKKVQNLKQINNNQINTNLMKKLVLLCFLSIVAMLNSTTFAQDCCFWVEKNNSTIPEEVYSLNTPVWQGTQFQTDYYYIHFTNNCGLDSLNTKVSIGWEIFRNGQLLSTNLSQYAKVTFQIHTLEYGWIGAPVLSGLGNHYDVANINDPSKRDFPGAMPNIGNQGISYLYYSEVGGSLPNVQNFNYLNLHFLQYASRTNGIRMKVEWLNYATYEMNFTLYQRSCGTEIQYPYQPSVNQHMYVGGHQSNVTGIISQFTLDPMPRGAHADAICAGDIYSFGVKPDGTPYTYFANSATWPNPSFATYIVPSYTQPQPCFGPSVARIDTLTLTVNPIPPMAIVANQEICGEGDVTFTVNNIQPTVIYRWYSDPALTNMIAEGNTATVSVLNPSNVTTAYNYYVVAYSPFCNSLPTMVTVTSNPIPELNLIAYNETTCPYIHTENVGVTALPGSFTGTLSYVWTGATGTTDNAIVNIIADCGSEYPYSVLVTDAKGCNNTIAGQIVAVDEVAPVVSPAFIVTATTIGCNLDNVPAALDLNGLISAGFIFSDNCTDPLNGTNFTVTSRDEIELGCTNTLRRYYILYDYCGNESDEFYMEYNVIDNVAPTYTANSNLYTAIPGPDCTFSISQDILDQILADFDPADNCSDVTTTFSVEANDLITTTTIVTVTFTDACENATIATATVTVPALLSSTLSTVPSSLEACTGSSFTFTVATMNGVEPVSFTWSDTQLEGDVVTVTPVLDDINVDQDFTYTVTVMDANNCASINSVTVKVHGLPTFTISDDVAICLGESTTIMATYDITPGEGDGDGDGEGDGDDDGGDDGEIPYDPIPTYQWSTGATTASIIVNPSVTTTYTVTVTSPFGCSDVKMVTVTVNELPAFTAVKTADNTFCVGTNGAIDILPNDDTYNYFVGTTQISLPYEGLAPGTYTITAQNPTTLCTSSASPITILDVPVLPVAAIAVSAITEPCIYEPITVDITATSSQDEATYMMTVNGETLEHIEGVASYTFTMAGTYTFATTTTNPITGCVSTSVSQVVNIYPLPVNPTLTANNTEICLGETVTLTANPMMTGFTYTFDQAEPTLVNSLDVTPELVGENIYNVVITTEHGCTATATVTVIVNPLPVIQSITAAFDCPGLVNPVTAVVIGGTAPYTLNWSGNVTVDEELETVTLNNIICGSENIVNLAVVDSKGCAAAGSVTIMINDVTPPTIVFEGTIMPELTVGCNSIPTQRTQDVVVTDNCTPSIAIVISMLPEVIISGPCANTYDIERRWTAQDACGNISTIMQLIHVVDAVVPMLTTVPADVAVSCDMVPAANIEDPALTATDNCSASADITFSYSETIGQTAIANTYFIYRDWVATDECGNVSLPVRQTITVTDEIAPTLITSALPMDLTLACSDMIPAPAVLEYSDNCDGQIVISFAEVSTQSDDINDSEYYNYTITRTWFATDAAGNSTSTTTQVITVQDVVAPVVDEEIVVANITLNCNEAIPAPAPVAFIDNCDQDLTITYNQVSTQGADANLPTYYNYTITRTWFATDATGLVSPTVTQVITVQDISVPTVVENTVPANVTLNCQDAIPAPAAVLFTDACDADLTINYSEVSTQGSTPNTFAYYNYTITRTWSATDASGNTSAVITQVITVQDITAPVIVASSLPADVTITCYDVIPPVANVMYEDNCSTPSITYNQTSTFVSNPENILYYNYIITRTWFATDASGNVSPTSTQVITIVDTDAPTVVLASVPADATVSCGDIPDAPTVLFTDACDATPTVTFTEVSTQEMNPALATYYNYTITRTWFATDASNHVSPTVTQVITVQDIMAPVVVEATIPENITINCQDAIPAAPTVQFTDNCDLNPVVVLNVVTTRGSNPAAASYYNYTITRTWNATDASGNVADVVTQVITVQDVTNPAFSFVPANVTIYTAANCTYNALPAVTGTATATDNCYFPVVSYTDEVIAGANVGQWTINRTWRAQDLSGNFVTAVQVITVTDNLFPTFTAPANQSVCRNYDGTYANLVTTDLMGVPTNVEDNCTTNPAVSYTDDLTNIGDVNTDGYITRTWTVTDAVGNVTSATQTIAVLHRPTVTITGPTTICANTSIILTGNGATSYVWSTNAITPSIEVTEAGTYSVVGTITNGCSNSAEITVTQFEIPTITSTVNDQICIGEVINLNAQAADANQMLLNGNWSVQMFSGSTNTTTNYTNVMGALVHTSIPVFENTYFQLIFTDVNGCAYNHTTETTIVTDAPRLRLYTDQAAAPNNVLNVTTGQDAKFYIKAEACADLNRRAQIQFQVYKDGVALTDLGQYLTDQYLSVSYFTAQNGITNPNPNNTYYNPIATGTFPYANTAQYAPWNGFFVSWTTNAYNWFYMHFFNERFITVDINAFSQPGVYTITYDLVGADATCNITDNSTNYTAGLSYGGSGFQFCNNTTVMASNTMIINVTGNAIPDAPAVETLPVSSTDLNVNVYPNPSNGNNIKLSFENIEGATAINVVSLNGKVLYEFNTNINSSKRQFELPTLDLAPGIYFIQVVNNNAVLTKKLIIQK